MIELKRLKCKRCGYEWYPRILDGKIVNPTQCASKSCRSPYWDRQIERPKVSRIMKRYWKGVK